MDLNGKVALVTGGNGGLGQRICHALAKEGASIAFMYAKSRDQAEKIAHDLTTRHQVDAAAFACDITDPDAIGQLLSDVTKTFGRLDILINDAAYNKSIPFADLDNLTIEEWDRILAINLTGPMRLTKAVASYLKAGGHGRIVNIASVAGLSPTGSSIAYAVAKAGLIHLTRCMAVALAPETLVNCIPPGLLEGTRATANLRPEMVEAAAAGALLKKAADKDDCADMVVPICRTDTMTGQTIVIDSGAYFIKQPLPVAGIVQRPRHSAAGMRHGAVALALLRSAGPISRSPASWSHPWRNFDLNRPWFPGGSHL